VAATFPEHFQSFTVTLRGCRAGSRSTLRRGVCPPSSLDCNPFDYFVWGVFKFLVISKFRNKSNDLIQKMKEVMGSLGRDTLAKACTSFRSRIEAVLTAAGSFTEYVDCQYVSLLIFFTSVKSADFQQFYSI
jgi:hypothetical protein